MEKKLKLIIIIFGLFLICTKLVGQPFISINGTIYDSLSKLPLVAEVLLFSFENDSLISSTQSNNKGIFKIKIPSGVYEVVIDKTGYIRKSIFVNTFPFEVRKETSYSMDVALNQIDKEYWFNFAVFFDYKSIEVKPDYYNVIWKMADSLSKYEDVILELAVHSDDIGSQEYNYQLTLRRGQSVRDLLLQLGIDERKIRIIPYGKLMPRYPNDNEQNRAKNRRCEFRIVSNE
ncbi:MAG: OmpA family protein [Ignavibacteria bacterium]|nr:OmpA family protein [Ignavibacteria bacterium]